MTLFLDIDDTLFNSESAYLFGMNGIGIDSMDPLFLKARELTKIGLPKFAPAARSRFLYFKKYLELTGHYTPEKHFQLSKKYEELVALDIQAQWKKLNRPQLFKEIRKKYSCIALVTNETLRMQTLKIMAIDPNRIFFDFLITSEEVGFEKPHPSIFKAALLVTKTSPESVLMVGDSFENDILGSRALKIPSIKTIEFKNDQKFDEQTQIIDTLRDLENLTNSH